MMLGAAIVCALGGAAAAQMKSFRTSSGHEFSFRPVESLDCSELDSVLAEIDQANYRAINSQRPSDPGDRALYDYENRASKRWARRCGGVTKSFGRAQGGSNWGFGR